MTRSFYKTNKFQSLLHTKRQHTHKFSAMYWKMNMIGFNSLSAYITLHCIWNFVAFGLLSASDRPNSQVSQKNPEQEMRRVSAAETKKLNASVHDYQSAHHITASYSSFFSSGSTLFPCHEKTERVKINGTLNNKNNTSQHVSHKSFPPFLLFSMSLVAPSYNITAYISISQHCQQRH